MNEWVNNILEFGDRYFAYGYTKVSDNNPYLAVVKNGNF